MTTKVSRNLYQSPLDVRASVATTSGTTKNILDLTGAKRVTINFTEVTLSATSSLGILLGDAGGFETSGYLSAASTGTTGVITSNSSGQFMVQRGSGTKINGSAIFTLMDEATNTWAYVFVGGDDDAARYMTSGGSKSLSQPLTQMQVKSWNGTDTFTAGKFNVVVEY